MKSYVYQIYYDNNTQGKLSAGFIPLDNTKNERPDWFEFWVILSFLRKNTLEDGAWYGFLSPKFPQKTGFTPSLVQKVLENYDGAASVVLLSAGWDQLSYFMNPFEQGEVWHPGLLSLSQKFFDESGIRVDLSNLVTDTTTSVFSNTLIAKKEFWVEWGKIAELFFDYAENSDLYKSKTSYASPENQYPMKTFIQERLASYVLATGNYKTVSPERSLSDPIFTKLFPDDIKTRKLLQTCDVMKNQFRQKADGAYLEMYWKIRGEIEYRLGPPKAI